MKPYTFYLHDTGHPTPAFDFVQCDDDSEALDYARTLLGRYPEYVRIEVYDGGATRVDVRRDEPRSWLHWEDHAEP